MRSYQANIITKSPATPTGPSATGSAPGIWRMDEVAYWVKQGVWPNASIINDPNFRNVSLLLSTTALSNANNNLFVDSSGAFNPISRNGNATQGSVTPYGASWSNFFDGSGDYFTVPYTTANFDWYTAGVDFTIECWFFANSLTGTSYVDGGVTKSTVVGNRSATATTDYWSFGPNAGGTVTFYYYNGGPVAVNSTSTITANTWNHIAMTKTSSGITIFVNGVAQTTTAISGTPQSSVSFPLTVGQGNNTSFNGYVSNLRIVRGTAIYSGNFTVPTVPLTAVTNTTLLTCQSNRFRDASANNLTLTVTGNTSVTEFSPFAPAYPGIVYDQSDITNWSGYFASTGTDGLSFTSTSAVDVSTGDFTFECWVYFNGFGSDKKYIIQISGSSYWQLVHDSSFGISLRVTGYSEIVGQGSNSGWVVGQWYHVALVRSGNNWNIYRNGVSIASATNSSSIGYYSPTYVANYSSGNSINGYMSNVRLVKGTAVYTSTFTPPTSPLTAISGTGLLTLQNAAFTDNSTNNFVITPSGNATVTGNSPFNPVGYWSLYGPSTAGATVPQTTATDLGSGSFTVECWVNLQNYTTDGIVTKRRTDTLLTGSWGIFVNASGFVIFTGVGWASTYTATTNAIPLNTWTHIAVSRSGTNLSVYVNGVRVINATDSYNYTCSTYMIIKLGGNSGGNYPSGSALNGGVTGSISNLRIVQGTAVYDPASTTVTVPTSPLTAISGTSFLTLQNGTMKDNSTNNNTSILLYNSAASLQSFNPFYSSTIASNGGSMYFDGTGDYLALQSSPSYALGSGDFILEVWVNPTVQGGHGSGNSDCIIDFRPAANGAYGTLYSFNSGTSINWYANTAIRITGGAIPNGAWSHLCVSRVSGTTRLFINGVQSGSNYTDSTNYLQTNPWIGQFNDGVGSGFFQGYMSGMRIVKGSGISATFTPPTAPQTPTANTTLLVNGMNAGAYDATAINDMETVGNAQVSTAVSKFGGSSMYFDGSGDYIDLITNQVFAFGTGAFTIEGWFYTNTTSGDRNLVDFRPTGTNGAYPNIFIAGGGYLSYNANGSVPITGTTAIATGTWYHFALARSGTSTKLFLNGVQEGSTYTDSTTYIVGDNRPRIATGGYGAGVANFNGYLDDVRITKGVARYIANFTPPTQAFPPY